MFSERSVYRNRFTLHLLPPANTLLSRELSRDYEIEQFERNSIHCIAKHQLTPRINTTRINLREPRSNKQSRTKSNARARPSGAAALIAYLLLKTPWSPITPRIKRIPKFQEGVHASNAHHPNRMNSRAVVSKKLNVQRTESFSPRFPVKLHLMQPSRPASCPRPASSSSSISSAIQPSPVRPDAGCFLIKEWKVSCPGMGRGARRRKDRARPGNNMAK